MKPQVWNGDTKPTEERMSPIRKGERIRGKPTGGIWTSPLQGEESPWLRFSSIRSLGDRNWVLIPEDDVSVFQIESKEDIDQLEVIDEGVVFKTLNYEELFEIYDAIYVSGGLTHPVLGVWDCESVVWSEWKFKQVKSLEDYIGVP